MLRLRNYFGMTKQQIADYLKIASIMNRKELENEVRLIGLKFNDREKGITKAKLYEMLAKNVGDKQEKALKRLEALTSPKTSPKIDVPPDNQFKILYPTRTSRVRQFYSAPFKKDEVDNLRNYQMNKIIGIFPEILVDTSSALFPEQYSREMLEVFVKAGTHNDVKRELKRFFQRSSLSMISNRALSPLLHLKASQAKRIALEVMELDKETRSMLIYHRSCISKSKNNIGTFLRFVRKFPNQARILINYYSIVSLQKLIDVQFRRTQKPDFHSIKTNLNTFIILNSKMIRHQDPQIDNILLTMFKQLKRKLEQVKLPTDNVSMMNWTDLLYELDEHLSIYSQYRDDVDSLIDQYTENLEQFHVQHIFMRNMEPTDAMRTCLRTISLISKSKVSSRLVRKLTSRLFAWPLEHISSQYLVDLLTFLDHNNMELEQTDAQKLSRNPALYNLGLHGTWLSIKILSGVGWHFLHNIVILSMRLDELSSSLHHLVDDQLYEELLHDVDILIHDLHGEMQRGQTTDKPQDKTQPIPFPVSRRVQEPEEYPVGSSGVILEDFL